MSSSEWLPPVAGATDAPPGEPGWYPDPRGRGQRYWTGWQWSEQLAAHAPALDAVRQPASTGDWVGGVLLSVLVPVVGLIAGAVYVAKGGAKRQVGIICVALSCVTFLGWVIVATASSGGAA
jgi:hypothetical protein